MSLNTNGWDYGYHLHLDKVNDIIDNNAVKDKNTVETFVSSLNFQAGSNVITDITSLNSFIKNLIKSSVQSINALKLYDQLSDKIFDDIANPVSTELITYLLEWLEKILVKIHAESKVRDSLSLRAKTTYTTPVDLEFDDSNEINVLKNRAKIYLENEHYPNIYDYTHIFTTFNDIKQKSLATAFSFTEVIVSGMVKTLLSALVPVTQINKHTLFFNDAFNSSKIIVIQLENLSKWKFCLGGNGNVAKIQYNSIGFKVFNYDMTAYEFPAGTSFNKNDIKIDVSLDLNWVSASFISGISISDKNIVITEYNSGNFPASPDLVLTAIQLYINHSQFNLTPLPAYLENIGNFAITHNYHRYHYALSYLNIAALEAIAKHEFKWIFPTTTRYAVMDSVTGSNKLEESVLSICCMIKGNKNNNPATPDLNAIPSGATSALVIDRSVFGEHMVVPQIAKGILANGTGNEFVPKSNYSFHNKEKVVLKYEDYRKANSYGFFHFIDYINLAGSWLHSQGSFGPNQGTISIEEDHITFRAKDVYYMYSIENYPKITQNYKINLYKKKDESLNVSAQIEDIDMKYFHTDFLILAWSLFLKNSKIAKENAIYNPKDGHDSLSYYLSKYILTEEERNTIIRELINNMDDLNNRRMQRIQELQLQEVNRLRRLDQEREENERRIAAAELQLEEAERLRLEVQDRLIQEQEEQNEIRLQEQSAKIALDNENDRIRKEEALRKWEKLIGLAKEKVRDIEKSQRLLNIQEIKKKKNDELIQQAKIKRYQIETNTRDAKNKVNIIKKYVGEKSLFKHKDDVYEISDEESKDVLNRTLSDKFNANVADEMRREAAEGLVPLKAANNSEKAILSRLGSEGARDFGRIEGFKKTNVKQRNMIRNKTRNKTALNVLNKDFTKIEK